MTSLMRLGGRTPGVEANFNIPGLEVLTNGCTVDVGGNAK
jgi:hypothetical protein